MAILVQSNKKPSVTFPSQTGSIVTFNSQYAGLPLKSCVVNFEFEDDTGIDSLDFSATGKNLWGHGDVNGTRVTRIILSSNIPTGNYVISGVLTTTDTDTDTSLILVYLKGGTQLSIQVPRNTRFSATISAASPITEIRFYGGYNFIQSEGDIFTYSNIQIELGNTATDFVPFGDNKLFTFGKTIQYGSLNVLTGELTNNDTIPPEVINLGGMDISTLQGENNLFASTGETTVEHIKIGG